MIFNKWFNFANYQKRLRRLYITKRYRIIPEIPSEEESKRILENYKSFPFSLVPKEYIGLRMKVWTRFDRISTREDRVL